VEDVHRLLAWEARSEGSLRRLTVSWC
jgi:hypothetical protein